MRSLVTLLCLLLCATVLTVPFARQHAHLGHAEATTQVHGGHSHELDHADHHESPVVYLTESDSQHNGSAYLDPAQWLLLFCVVAVLLAHSVVLRRIDWQFAKNLRLPSQYPPWPPPLRGPPLSL
jgi:hypothetical protein